MRTSCNGCRVLRKGCADNCTIRPCLAWIRSPDAQANATVFLAKFYGRAGLINLLAAAPDDAQRPALFRSLLYEACGRAANPVYGASGLFSTGNWEACQAAVQAVLEGRRIPQVGADQAAPHPGLVAAYGVRHIPKDSIDRASAALRVSRASFKRASSSSSSAVRSKRDGGLDEESDGSHDHVVEDDGKALAAEQKREQSSEEEAEAGSHVSQAEQSASATVPQVAQDDGEIGLELTLGFGPATRVLRSSPPPVRFEASSLSAESGHIGLLLGLPV